ncbi:MAG: OmpA family protein [Desulfobacteraceae bacterium]|nr:OmpA family protein [Desulfobacteraceae bacterium]
MKSKIIILFTIFSMYILFFGVCFADTPAGELQVLIPDHEAKITFQEIDENKILVSALDSEGNPVKGLIPDNFKVQKGTKQAKVTAAEVLKTRKDVGINYVLVIDNSFSMQQRKAVKPLLSALDEFLKIVRPFDNVEVVVFDGKKKFSVDGQDLHLNTFKSNSVIDLKDFFQKSFNKGLSSQTFLYEGILGGLDIISNMPEKSNKFLVVFTDGEDLNSEIKKEVIAPKAKGLKNFSAYAIDFMPSEAIDQFMKTFSETNGGKIWKATSATNLLPIFKEVSTTLLHQYVVEYRFLNPPTGTLSLGANAVNFDILTTLDGRALPYYLFFETGRSEIHPKYNLFADKTHTDSFNENQFSTVLDKYFSILNITGKRLTHNFEIKIQIIGYNSGVEKSNQELSEKRAKAVASYLQDIWGIDSSRIKIIARGLPEKVTPADTPGSRSESQRVEIVFEPEQLQTNSENDFKVEHNNVSKLEILTEIEAEYGVSNWEIAINSKDGVIKKLKGRDEPLYGHFIAFDKMSVQKLSSLEYLKADIKITDANNDTFETSSVKCPVNVSSKPAIHEFILPPKGSLSIAPASVTIEEVTIIDSSPLLNYVFFDTGESKIPERYKLLKSQAEAKEFDETKLQNAIEKYNNVLNITGKRLSENYDAAITLTGCISNYGKEKNKVDLSKARAEEVKAYLKYIWGIDPDRIKVVARKLPLVPSTSRVDEGRLENQRVEIHSDTPEILDSVKSTYAFAESDSNEINIKPAIQIGYDLKNWTIEIKGADELLKEVKGQGNDIQGYSFNLKEYGLQKIGRFDDISVSATMTDVTEQTFTTDLVKTSIKYIKRIEREAQKLDYKVVEKYALILFDYDSSAIKERNKVVLDRVVKRIKELPQAKVTIVGHSDTIGKEDYNVTLSLRRAKAVYKMVMESGISSPERVVVRGDGPNNPPYDNATAEGRSFNRTVIIALEYEEK